MQVIDPKIIIGFTDAQNLSYEMDINFNYNKIIAAINSARTEAIEHCAAILKEPIYDFNGKRYNDQLKELLLNQINELK